MAIILWWAYAVVVVKWFCHGGGTDFIDVNYLIIKNTVYKINLFKKLSGQ